MEPTIITCLPGSAAEYKIVVGESVLDQIGRDIASRSGIPASQSVVIVTDKNVWRWHGLRLLASLSRAGVREPLLYVLPPGEGSKTREVKEAIEDFMLAKRCAQTLICKSFGRLYYLLLI